MKRYIQKEFDRGDMHKILIVEDETLIALNMKYGLVRHGFNVLQPVATGIDALGAIEEENPSIVFLDIRLSGAMTGLDVARKIGIHKDSLSIIFMTGYLTPEIKAEAMALKPVAFLEKPVDINDILKVLKTS